MTAKTYSVLPGKVPTEDDQWNDILQMSMHCPITRAFVRQVEYGMLNREQAAIGLARALIIDRKVLVEENIKLRTFAPSPPIYISVSKERFEEIKASTKNTSGITK